MKNSCSTGEMHNSKPGYRNIKMTGLIKIDEYKVNNRRFNKKIESIFIVAPHNVFTHIYIISIYVSVAFKNLDLIC